MKLIAHSINYYASTIYKYNNTVCLPKSFFHVLIVHDLGKKVHDFIALYSTVHPGELVLALGSNNILSVAHLVTYSCD